MAEGETRTISSTEFMRNVGKYLEAAHGDNEAVIVASHGRPRVAIVAVREYEALLEARRQLAWTRLARLTGDGPAKGVGSR